MKEILKEKKVVPITSIKSLVKVFHGKQILEDT